MRTEELIPYERNQKKHDEKQIRNVANSIRRFGWQQPIVVDGKGVIIIGHCRWEAAKLLGAETVPVVCADGLTEDEVRELRIVDNKTNESPWDFEALGIDMQELDFAGFEFDFPQLMPEDDAEPVNLDAGEKDKPSMYVVRLKFMGYDEYAAHEREIKEMAEKWACDMVVSDHD